MENLISDNKTARETTKPVATPAQHSNERQSEEPL